LTVAENKKKKFALEIICRKQKLLALEKNCKEKKEKNLLWK
jgi:hypothetical protein